jgi:hypothetical protein
MPYGQILTDSITDSSGGVLAPSSSVFRNRILNGDMRIDQRNAGASGTASSATANTVDRWGYFASQASKGSWQQNAASVTPPVGFTNYLGFTSSSAYSITSTDIFNFYHRIEGLNIADLAWGTASAAPITISFWVRSSLTGTFGGAILNSAQNRSYPFSYTINSANTWEKETITIAGDTSGTWLTTNGVGATIVLNIGSGSTYSSTAGAWAAGTYTSATGATSVVGTNGATFYITGVQLEKGSTATSFDYRPYTTELQLCQRYLPAFISSSTSEVFGFGFSTNTTDSIVGYKLPVTARVAPTGVTVSSAGHFSVSNGSGGTASASAASFVIGNQDVVMMLFTRTSLTAGQGSYVSANSASGKLLFTGCEL